MCYENFELLFLAMFIHNNNSISFFSSSNPLLFSVFAINLLFVITCNATELSFNFTTIEPNNPDIVYKGHAVPLESGIQLTENKLYQTGHATYARPMHLWDKRSGSLADFNTKFSFSINYTQNSSYADGLAFFIASEDYRMPKNQGNGLGLACCELLLNSTSNPFVAVEFDTLFNDILDSDETEHVGIDVNSLQSIKSARWYSSLDGRIMDAQISYNSSSKNLSVSFTGVISENIPIQQHLHHVIDLSNYLSEYVIFGFSAATGSSSESHTIHSWSFSSTLKNITTSPSPGNKIAKRAWFLIGAGILVLVGGGLMFLIWYIKSSRKKYDDQESPNHKFERLTGAKNFSLDVLACATNNFDEKEKLGEGGFGAVFKGYLKDFNTCVAVKRISSNSVQGISEYAAEVIVITQLRHRNLVQLIGWCHERNDLLLVYEYMPNRSLDYHLFSTQNLLNWEQRYKIGQGLASALHYLHQGWRQCVLHRDIKASNVMLDSEFNPMLGDFGLARLVDHNDARSQTLLGGSHGYIAPECLDTGKTSKESDVFSFGVVALEIACGKKPFVEREDGSQVHIVKWVWEFYADGNIFNAVDKRLNGHYISKQMECLMIVGLWCAHPDYCVRPSIREAINVLNLDSPLPLLSLTFPGPITHSHSSPGYPTSSSVTTTITTVSTQYLSTTDSSNLKTSPTSPLITNTL